MAKNYFIGISAGLMHPDPERNLFKTKTVCHIELQMQEWLMSAGLIPVILPQDPELTKMALQSVDGVLLFGGADVAPESYGEIAKEPEWAGDRIRDKNEIFIVTECLKQNMPVLGICRGIQILNVAMGGTLFQDIATQTSSIENHRDPSLYDKNYHAITIEPGSFIEDLYLSSKNKVVNSVHHQSIKDLAPDLKIAAKSTEDGIIEAVEHKDPNCPVAAVQWHPEWLAYDTNPSLNPDYLLVHFKEKIRQFVEKR